MTADSPDKHSAARIGESLRYHVEELIESYVARMRNDPLIPLARTLPEPILEDHALSFLGDVIQSLVVVESAEVDSAEERDLEADGNQIQRLVADLHGRQRHRIGWAENALQREYQILTEEIATLVARYAPPGERGPPVSKAIDLFTRLLIRSRDASLRGYRAAAAENRS